MAASDHVPILLAVLMYAGCQEHVTYSNITENSMKDIGKNELMRTSGMSPLQQMSKWWTKIFCSIYGSYKFGWQKCVMPCLVSETQRQLQVWVWQWPTWEGHLLYLVTSNQTELTAAVCDDFDRQGPLCSQSKDGYAAPSCTVCSVSIAQKTIVIWSGSSYCFPLSGDCFQD